MVFNKANVYRYALSMELQSDKFTYAVIDIETKKSVLDKSFTLTLFNKDELSKILNDDFFKLDFKSIVLSVGTTRHTLVPNVIFKASKPAEIFSLNHQAPIDNIDYNRIPELSIVSIYEIPLWIKSLFIIKMPRVKIVHTSTVLLKGIFKQAVFTSKLHILWQQNAFYLAITNKGKLNYFNLFDTNDITNLVYYILFVLEQKEIELKNVQILMYGITESSLKLKELRELLNHKIEVSLVKEKAENFILTNNLLCV